MAKEVRTGLMQKSAGHRLQTQRYVKNAGIKTLHICSYELHLSMCLTPFCLPLQGTEYKEYLSLMAN